MHNVLIVCLILIFLPSFQAHAQNRQELAAISRMEMHLDSLARTEGFSGVVALDFKGEILFEGAFGLADEEAGQKLKPRNKFMIASISKSFTAAAILRLAQENELGLDNSLKEILPYYKGAGAKRITIRQLLNHTSGIPDFINDDPIGFNLRRLFKWKPTDRELVGHIGKKQLLFRPGDQYSYSNSGYMLLAQIIEKVSKKPYQDYISEKIIKPLGMKQTGFGPLEEAKDHANASRGKRWKKRKVKNFKTSWTKGLGEMHSTARDLVAWGRSFRDTLVLNEEWRQKPFIRDSAAVEDHFTLYGFGWELGQLGMQRYQSHGGYFPGWTSYLYHFPDQDLTIAVVSNYDRANPYEIGESMANTWFKNTIPRETRDAHTEHSQSINGDYRLTQGELEGDFWLKFGKRVSVMQYNDTLWFDPNRADLVLRQTGLNTWEFLEEPWQLKFERNLDKVQIHLYDPKTERELIFDQN